MFGMTYEIIKTSKKRGFSKTAKHIQKRTKQNI